MILNVNLSIYYNLFDTQLPSELAFLQIIQNCKNKYQNFFIMNTFTCFSNGIFHPLELHSLVLYHEILFILFTSVKVSMLVNKK